MAYGDILFPMYVLYVCWCCNLKTYNSIKSQIVEHELFYPSGAHEFTPGR